MLQILSEHNESTINTKLEDLQKSNTVEVISMATCPAGEKYSRYDVQITVCVDIRPHPDFMNSK